MSNASLYYLVYQIPFPNSMQYMNRIQQLTTVQMQQQNQQQTQHPAQQTQQQAATVQVQGVVTVSQPQVMRQDSKRLDLKLTGQASFLNS